MPQNNIAYHALTSQGLELATRLADVVGGTVFSLARLGGEHSFTSLPEHIASHFHSFSGHVFIAAAGIAVRCIAPHLGRKDSDPAVVVLDQEGRFAVSLLSGHLGGANELASRCAAVSGGQAVITTATDSAGIPSMDMLAVQKGLVIGNLDRIKTVNGTLLDGTTVQVFDPENLLGVAGSKGFQTVAHRGDWKAGAPGVWVSFREDCPDEQALRLYSRELMLGVGCRRGVPEADIFAHIEAVFAAAGLAIQSIGGLASVDLKADEAGLLAVADRLGVTPKFYGREQLDAVEAPNPSGAVMDRVGVGSVAEASALVLSDGGELIVEKTKTQTVTLAVARRRIC